MYHKLLILLVISFLKQDVILERFSTPVGYVRATNEKNTFAHYLQHLPLLPENTEVKLYNGKVKSNKVHAAVIDMSIGKKDLQQCADAVMRLRAEYLFEQKKYTDIHFKLTNGFEMNYSEWIKGKRLIVNGNKTSWKLKSKPSNTHNDLLAYLEVVFSYAGTLSLSKELKSIQLSEVQIGDVFIEGGSPGHAVIIVDLCYHSKTKEKMLMLAQSYMPAQNIHILKNFSMDEQPWFKINNQSKLETPEWDFKWSDLKRFE
jgi:hypothetical protein